MEKNGRVEDSVKANAADMSIHIDMKQWQENVRYEDSHYVDHLMAMLKDCNTRKDLVVFTVEDLLDRR